MKTLKTIILLIIVSVSYAQAQTESKSSNQTRTIEINNSKGDLEIKFENDVITKFTINGEQISEEQYADYQNIIDGFSGEKIQPKAAIPPTHPVEPNLQEGKKDKLLSELKDYLTNNNLINPSKHKVQLKQDFLKVNRKKLSSEAHQACLDIFNDVYGAELNSKSSIKLKKSKGNSSSSIRIID